MSVHSDNVGVVILAAGQGTRMKSTLPKVLHELNGKPLVRHLVDHVIESGVCDKPVVVVSKDHTLVQEALGDLAHYAIQEQQLGTGHATASAEGFLRDRVEDVVVLYGDMPFLSSGSIQRLVDVHQTGGAVLSMVTVRVPHFEDRYNSFNAFGRIVRNERGDIQRVVEWKDATDSERRIQELCTGFFCFDALWLWDHLKQLKADNVQQEYYLVDLVGMAIQEEQIIETSNIPVEEAFGINSQEDLKTVRQYTGKEK